jgi:peptide/nickel transport system substrate-binding protein
VHASDVVYSTERVLAFKRGLAPLLAALVAPGSTKAVDPRTVEFNLNRASPLFLALLPEIAIVNAELLKANEINNDWGRAWLQSNDAGSGGYAFKERLLGGAVVTARFADHWNRTWPQRPIEEVVWHPMLDPEARVAALRRGDVQVLQSSLLPDQVSRLREAKDIAVLMSDSPRTFMGLLHTTREPFKDAAFRKIIAQAFDAGWFMQSTLEPGATRLAVPVPPTHGTPPPGLMPSRYDIAAAAEALAKLKPTLTKELVIGAVAGEPESERAALIMLDGLIQLGIPARILSEPWPAVSNRMADEKLMYDILFYWRGARYLDANNWVGEMFDCDLLGAGNASWYCNREIDKIIKEARATVDPKARRQGFEKAAALLAEDQAALFIASGKRPVAYAKTVKGLELSPVGETIEIRSITLEPPPPPTPPAKGGK